MKGHRRRPGRGMPFRNAARATRRSDWRAALRALMVLLALTSVVGVVAAYSILSRGLSTHDEPSRVEAMLARGMRRWATPQSVRDRRNPVEPTHAVLEQAMNHYADHCATCHANNGSGNTTIGRALYPRAPDMRAETTQSLTDGELFSIIEHGIRLTGMPGWGNGTPEGERESWALVHFVRGLPKLTDEDIERMEALNPKSPGELKEDEEARRFLEGDAKPSEGSPQDHRH
jgi:mono/diheme cytochrome c family protein